MDTDKLQESSKDFKKRKQAMMIKSQEKDAKHVKAKREYDAGKKRQYENI